MRASVDLLLSWMCVRAQFSQRVKQAGEMPEGCPAYKRIVSLRWAIEMNLVYRFFERTWLARAQIGAISMISLSLDHQACQQNGFQKRQIRRPIGQGPVQIFRMKGIQQTAALLGWLNNEKQYYYSSVATFVNVLSKLDFEGWSRDF